MVEKYWTGVPRITTKFVTRLSSKEPVKSYKCRMEKQGVLFYCKETVNSKWLLRATLDKAIEDTRSIPQAERTRKEQYLAEEAIYFADNEGNFMEEKVYQYMEDVHSLLEPNELLLLEELRKDSSSTTSIRLNPSVAMKTLKDSQEMFFGTGERLLLDRLGEEKLDDLDKYDELETKVDLVAREAMEEVIDGTGFDLDKSMINCRTDESIPAIVQRLVGDGSDLSELEKYETATAKVAMKLVLILVEKQGLLRLISGRLRAYKRVGALQFGEKYQNGCGSSTVLEC